MADIQYNIDYLCRVFKDIANNIVIKYTGSAEDDESFESRSAGDLLINAIYKKDNFFMYNNYISDDFNTVGYTDKKVIEKCFELNDFSAIPEAYHDKLLKIARQRYIDTYEEENNYYRELFGLPDYEDTEEDFVYPDQYIMKMYNIAVNVPIHRIRDVYNKQLPGLGDKNISNLETTDWFKKLIKNNPDKGYLRYVGSKRIPIHTSRKGKNFSILTINISNIDSNFLEEFTRLYEQSRDYFIKTIYNYHYRDIIEYYDNFIAMCILLMTFQQIAIRVPETYINRNFFNVNDIRDFYELYGVPYDLSIHPQIQNNIIRNLNMLMKSKATDKVVFDIISLLGFSDISVNKYYLVKNRKFDEFGVPIVKKKKKFNTNTGKVEEIYDYEEMYESYFYKMSATSTDITNAFKDASNKIPYKSIVSQDPYWIEDANTYNRIWDTQYNYVESKYLSLGISYSITDMMMDNALMLKMLLEKSYEDQTLSIVLPQITGTVEIPLFDVVCILICLTSSQHNLNAEIISLPSKTIAIQDYIDNTEHNTHLDTLKFNFKYFFENTKLKSGADKLSEFMRNMNKDSDDLYDEFMFDFKEVKDPKNKEIYSKIKHIMSPSDYTQFMKCITALSSTVIDPTQKIKYINSTYTSIKDIHKLLSYYMYNATIKNDDYMILKRLYDALYSAKMMTEMFTITGPNSGVKRTAYSYYEYIHNANPLLYNSIYKVDLTEEYMNYTQTNKLNPSSYTFDKFMHDIEKGDIYIDYSKFKDNFENIAEKKAYIFNNISHIITRITTMFHDLPSNLALKNDSCIENLLLKMLRYFKSYTIDILNLNTLFKMDYKVYNTIKFLDMLQITHIDINLTECLNMSYNDFITKYTLTRTMFDPKNNKVKFTDNLSLITLMHILYPNENAIKLRDACVSRVIDYITHDGFSNMRDNIKMDNGRFKHDPDTISFAEDITLKAIIYMANKDKDIIPLKDTIRNITKSIKPIDERSSTFSMIDFVMVIRNYKINDSFGIKDIVVPLK